MPGGVHAPFFAIGVVVGLANRIVRDDVENEVLGAVIGNLMRFAGVEEEGVAGFDGRRSIFVSDDAFAGDDMVELPLRAVGVIRAGGLARRDARDLDVKGMSLVEIGRLRL